MSDAIKHECGIVMIRLRKPLSYYAEKYGSPLYAINKLYLLMEKQHNRGQDGAGIATIRIDAAPGSEYISRDRSVKTQAINDIVGKIGEKHSKLKKKNADQINHLDWLRQNMPSL